MTAPVLIFDLDGTLVDSAPDLTAALNWTLDQEGLPPVALDDVRHMVGLGARRLIEQGVSRHGRKMDEEQIDHLLGLFLEYYRDNICRETKIFPDVDTVIPALAARHPMGICTNKPESLAIDLMEKLGLRRYFPVILGGDSVSHKKPDPRHFQAVHHLLDAARPAIMIGDSKTDVTTARAANAPVIAVRFGYSTVAPEELEADILIDRFADLPAAIARLMR